MGQTRTGLLSEKVDIDNYRFHLAAWDRIRLTIEPPADGAIGADLYWGISGFKEFNKAETGKKVVLDGLFPPGDYRLALNAKTTSDAEYKLTLERLKRFGCPVDCEPNDNRDFANPLPASHVLEGTANEWRDSDWYRLPVFDEATAIMLSSEPRKPVLVETGDYAARNLVVWNSAAGQWQGLIPAGVQTYVVVGNDGEYRFDVAFSSGPDANPTVVDSTLELAIGLDTTEVAAYREYGQQVAGTLRLINKGTTSVTADLEAATSDTRWVVDIKEPRVEIAANSERAVPLTVRVPADAWADWPVRISAHATTKEGAEDEAFVDISAGRETNPVNAVHAWSIPAELRGGFNVAWQSLGGRWVGEEDSAIGWGFGSVFDGMAIEKQGLLLRGGTQRPDDGVGLTVELAGNEPVDVVGLTINELAGLDYLLFLRNLDFALSLDGETFTPVVEGDLLPIKSEQAFVLKKPMAARYARLRLKHAFNGRAAPALSFGELKVITKPGIDISLGKGFNLADPTLGGHVVWSLPGITPASWDGSMLHQDGKYDTRRIKSGQPLEWVVGFHHDRAAQITRMEWVNPPNPSSYNKIDKVTVSVSIDSPIGPWQTVGEWSLPAGEPASVFDLEAPAWARFVRFSVAGSAGAKWYALPDALRIWERPTENEYRSILTEWGFASQSAIYEELHPLQVDKPFTAAGHDSRVKAAPLQFDQLVGGQVVLGKHSHWYKIDVPDSQNYLTITLGGDPTVRTVVQLEAGDGKQIPVVKSGASTSLSHTYQAVVESGGTYYLKIDEPPRNVAFLWDTSASVGPYLPVIYNSLMAYAKDVVPGQDAANLIPFGGHTLLRDWYGEPYILQTVLNDYPRKESNSEAEQTLSTASKALAPRPGTKAIVLVTDAATNRFAPVWTDLKRVQPRIFGLGVGSQGALSRNPAREQDLMQDWSRVNGGHYSHLLNEGEMEIAFDRAATMLRRPADYTLKVTGSFKEAPGPGTLRVISDDKNMVGGAAIELILDASGSMLKRLDGKRRIEIAKEVLGEAITEHIPPGTPVALRVFGHKEANSCRTDLELPLAPLDPATALQDDKCG